MSAGSGTNPRPPWAEWLLRHRAWLLVALTILFVIVVRVRLREMPLERDEGEYAYAGQLLLHGVPPYKEAYNMKLPGTYAAYAVIMAVLGQTPSAIHVGVMVVNAASIILVFLLGRKLLDEIAGATAAVCFGLMSLSPYILGLAGHATHFVVLPALGGMVLLVQRPESGVHSPNTRSTLHALLSLRVSPLLAGVLMGLALVMDQHGLFFGVFGFLYLVWMWLSQWLEARNPEKKLRHVSAGFRRVSAPPEVREAAASQPARRLNAIQAKKVQSSETTDHRPQTTDQRPASTVESLTEIPAVASYTEPRFQDTQYASTPKAFGIPNTQPPPSPIVALTLYSLGFLAPYVVTCLVLLVTGVFQNFMFWTLAYAGKYASAISVVHGPEMLRGGVKVMVGLNFLLWLLPWAGAIMIWWDERLERGRALSVERESVRQPATVRQDPRFFLMALLVCSLIAVSVGFYFRQHYFILLLPVAALLAGAAVSRAVHALRHDRGLELFVAIPVLGLFLVGALAAVAGNTPVWFGMTPAQVVRDIYGTTLFSEVSNVADYLKENTGKDARVAVLGSEPEIYFYARRRSASGYMYTYPLMETHSYALKMQEEMIAELERSKPDYVVYVDDDYSWLARENSQHKIDDWWKNYWPANLNLVMTIPVEYSREPQDIPGLDIKKDDANAPQSPRHLFVFKRR